MVPRLASLLLAAVVLPGCSAAAPGTRDSAPAPILTQPLSLDAVADPRQLASRLGNLRLLRDADATALVFVAYDTAGDLSAARVYHSRASLEESRAVEAVLRDGLSLKAIPRAVGWYRFTSAESPRLESIATPSPRPPRMLNRAHFVEALQRLADRPATPELAVRVRFYLEPDGRVGAVEMAESSGNIELDRQLLNVARVARFASARLDDVPVCAWVEMPVAIRRDRWEVADRSTRPAGARAEFAGPGF